jgi:hypothetical protein
MARTDTPPQPRPDSLAADSPFRESDQRLIIRLWVDQAQAEGRNPRWYGQIVNIAGGEPRYVRRLSEIGDVVVSVLEGMGVRFRWPNRVVSWLRHVGR